MGVKFTRNGKSKYLTREEFIKLMKVLKKRAILQKRERIINEMMSNWN